MSLFTELNRESEKQKQQLKPSSDASSNDKNKKDRVARKVTRKSTPPRDRSRESSRGKSRHNPRSPVRDQVQDHTREMSRQSSREYPSRDEIQIFNFHLRDELRVKVQADVPHHWQKELDELARELGVRKLELYRYMIGEFLGKTGQGRARGHNETEKQI